jgi:hypothetical protein
MNGIGDVTIDTPPMEIKGTAQQRSKLRARSAPPVPQATAPMPAIYVLPAGTTAPGMVQTQFGQGNAATALPQNQQRTSGPQIGGGNDDSLDIPPSAYDKISDFLEKLEKDYDDPEYAFTQYTDIISGKYYLGYRRICDIVNAVPKSSAPGAGGEWLKKRMGECASYISITDGEAQAIFQGMAKRVQHMNKEWAAHRN